MLFATMYKPARKLRGGCPSTGLIALYKSNDEGNAPTWHRNLGRDARVWRLEPIPHLFVGCDWQVAFDPRDSHQQQGLPEMRFVLFAINTLLVLVLAGCAYPAPQVDRNGLPVLGPIVVGDSRRPVTGSCRQTLPYWGHCDLLLEDRHGRRLDGHRIRSELDRIASRLPPFSQWVRPVEGPDESELPYDMHLLTISPAVVLAVPRETKRPRNCPSIYHDGCIQSEAFRAHSYWYRSSPKIRAGSFWFSPEQPSVNPINEAVPENVIAVDRAVVRLTSVQGEWRVVRDQ